MVFVPTERAPPALGVNINVAEQPVFPTSRSAAAMVKLTPETASPIAPQDAEGMEKGALVFVCTVTEAVAALAKPSVQPTSVTVTAVPSASAVPETAKTMEVAPGGPGAMIAPDDTEAEGVGEVAKKPEG